MVFGRILGIPVWMIVATIVVIISLIILYFVFKSKEDFFDPQALLNTMCRPNYTCYAGQDNAGHFLISQHDNTDYNQCANKCDANPACKSFVTNDMRCYLKAGVEPIYKPPQHNVKSTKFLSIKKAGASPPPPPARTHCDSQNFGGITYPRTAVGEFAYGRQGNSCFSRLCGGNGWQNPQATSDVRRCGITPPPPPPVYTPPPPPPPPPPPAIKTGPRSSEFDYRNNADNYNTGAYQTLNNYDAGACSQACVNNNSCKSFVSTNNNCYLKADVGSIYTSGIKAGTVLGIRKVKQAPPPPPPPPPKPAVRTAPYSPEFEYLKQADNWDVPVMGDMIPNVDVGACSQECAKNSACKSFSHNNNRCYLKAGATPYYKGAGHNIDAGKYLGLRKINGKIPEPDEVKIVMPTNLGGSSIVSQPITPPPPPPTTTSPPPPSQTSTPSQSSADPPKPKLDIGATYNKIANKICTTLRVDKGIDFALEKYNKHIKKQ